MKRTVIAAALGFAVAFLLGFLPVVPPRHATPFTTTAANIYIHDPYVTNTFGNVTGKQPTGGSSAQSCDPAQALGFYDDGGSLNFNCLNLPTAIAAPTISSGFCTSPTITWSRQISSLTFKSVVVQLDVGGTCVASTGTLALPATTNGWQCDCIDVTTASNVYQTGAGTTTTAPLGNFSRTLGTAANWVNGDDVRCQCTGD